MMPSAALFVCALASAGAPPMPMPTPSPGRWVVIVGNNASLSPELPPLSFADDDAAAYYRLLEPFSTRVDLLTLFDDRSQRRFGELTAKSRLPTRDQLQRVLHEVYAEIEQHQGPSELIFVFVGHGSLDDQGEAYVHLEDGPFTRRDLFAEVLAAAPADYVHVIVDACNAYSFVAGRGAPAGGQRFDDAFAEFLRGSDLAAYPKVGVLVAASEDQQTHEWSRIEAGVFSHQVRSALAGGADVNGDGRLEYSEVAAFVHAANSQLRSAGSSVKTFAWPPLRNRAAPLLDLNQGRGVRRIVLAEQLGGRIHIEGEGGDGWADINKVVGEPVAISLPSSRSFFVRGGQGERRVPAGERTLGIRDLQGGADLTTRGAAAWDYERNLFAQPFGRDYFRGYIADKQYFPPPAEVERSYLIDEDAAAPVSLSLSAGYRFSTWPTDASAAEHSGFVRAGLLVFDGLALTLGAEGAGSPNIGHSNIRQGWTAALAAGVEGSLGVLKELDVAASAELGYAVLGVAVDQGGGRTFGSVDAAVGFGRLEAGISLALREQLRLEVRGGVAVWLVTIDGRETVWPQPSMSVALTYRAW